MPFWAWTTTVAVNDTCTLRWCLVRLEAGQKNGCRLTNFLKLQLNSTLKCVTENILGRNRQCRNRILIHIWSALPSFTVWSEFRELDVLIWTERQTDNLRAEKRDLHSDVEWHDGLERWLSSVVAEAVSELLEIFLKRRHARHIPVCKPKVKLRERDGKARFKLQRNKC